MILEHVVLSLNPVLSSMHEQPHWPNLLNKQIKGWPNLIAKYKC